ncbi:MAG: hypothetical protein PVI31_12785 [Gemmatimonadota bacterium]
MSAPPVPPAPSKAKLLLATAVALVVAGIVLVTVVLPAEYDVDPLGTGEALGLVVLSGGGGVAPAIPVRSDGLIDQSEGYRLDRRAFELGPGEFVEFKYRLEAGQAMVYSWEASYWVRSEMHAEQDGATPGTAEFFEVVERGLYRNGSYVAPFSGIHGWYWLNENDRPVTVTLNAAGFFDYAAEFHEDVPPVTYDITTTPDALPVGEGTAQP